MSEKKKTEKKFVAAPEYPGGNAALKKFINENLRYPEEALTKQVEGVVHVSYTVTNDGNVEDILVKKGIGYGCDEEAVRVISLLKYEPAHNRGFRVRSTLRTRIFFRLPAAPVPVIAYSVVKENEKQKPAGKPAGNNSYGYTITFGKP
ncbi:hypothetical protein DSECCO2_284720 [anaerobic digester metagenome]